MPNAIRPKQEVQAVVTISLASLASGAGQRSAAIDNSGATRSDRGFIGVQIRTGTVPASVRTVRVYLIRQSDPGDAANLQDGRYNTAAYGDTDGGVTVEPVNSELLKAIQIGATANAYFTAIIPIYDPGEKFSIVIWNDLGQALHATAADHVVTWTPIAPEVQ